MRTTTRIGNGDESRRIVAALNTPWNDPLDLGCGAAHYTKEMPGVLLIDCLKMDGAPSNVHLTDIRNVSGYASGRRFGTVYLLDVMEHLTKEEGKKLLSDLYEVSDRIVFFTPLGELWVTNDDHPYSHKCGWLPKEAEDLGFTVWEWPVFHKWEDGKTFGAFWAWRDRDTESPSVDEISEIAGVPV